MPPISQTFMHQYYRQQLDVSDPAERIAALEAISARDDEPTFLVDAAVQLLADPAPGVREQAARVLLDVPPHEAAHAVAPLIAHADIAVRNLAGEVLTRMGKAAVEALRPYIDDGDKDVRKFAIDVLALLPAQSLALQLSQRLADADLNVVLSAVDALGSLRAAEYAADLRFVYERQPLARPNVVSALGALGGARNVAFLEAALDDENPVVQLAAAEALAGSDPGAGRDSVHVLETLLRKVDTVHVMARPIVLDGIVRLQEAHQHEVAPLPAGLRAAFAAMLDDPDLGYRKAGVRGLRFFLDAAAIDAVVAHAGQDDALDVEIFGLLAAYPGAFGRLAHHTAQGLLAVPTAAQFTLALLARQAVPEAEMADTAGFLCDHFRNLDVDARLAALNVSQRLDHPALHDVIRVGLEDRDPSVRSFAQEVARRLALPPGTLHRRPAPVR